MKPIRTPDMTDTLVGAEGSDVEPLPINRGDGTVASVWELADEDRTKLAEGGHIALVAIGDTHPPVALLVAAPYCERCSEPMTWSEHLKTFVCSEHEETCAGCGRPIDADGSKVWVVGPPEHARMYHWLCKPGQDANGSANGG